MAFCPLAFPSLPALAATRAERLFWCFIALHLVLWTLLPAWSSPNAPLDVIEGYAWGHEWLIGTYKHPPMQAWCLEIMTILTGRAAWAPFLASQIAVVVAFWAVWRTGRRIMSETQALIGVLLLEGVIYYNFTSPEFNPNVLQLAFWALIAGSFHRAVKENHLRDWLLLGVWGAGGLYAKYSTVLLLGVLGFLVLIRPEARRCLKGIGPYLALLTATLLFLPHLVWLWHNDFLPLTYIRERLQAAGPATRYIAPSVLFPIFLLSPVVFVVGQILALLPATLLFLVLDGAPDARRADEGISKFDQAFLAAVTFVPMILTLMMAIGFGYKIHDMWGAPFFNFAGLWAVAKFYPATARIGPRFVTAWTIIFLAGLLGYAGSNFLTPYIDHKAMRVHFPGSALAQQIDEAWHRRFATPLTYVVGDTWAGGNVAYYAPERPHLFINADTAISPWIDPDDVRKRGAVLVWCEKHCVRNSEGMPAFVHERFPQAELQKPLEIPRQTEADIPPVVIGWAIQKPGDGGQKTEDR
jgi:4-amino-4-deoxy-L-arabinose transferase-like glycosyltransferase